MGGYRGFEPNAQAVTGLMDRFGGDGPPLAQPYLLDDYGTGVRGAFAVGLGIFHRLRSGRGQHIDISLVETATYHQAAYLVRSRERMPDAARGIGALGSSPRIGCTAGRMTGSSSAPTTRSDCARWSASVPRTSRWSTRWKPRLRDGRVRSG